jgi:hypothetical protein
MYEGIFAMALRCTPCKTEREGVYSLPEVEIFFNKSGIKFAELGQVCGASRKERNIYNKD